MFDLIFQTNAPLSYMTICSVVIISLTLVSLQRDLLLPCIRGQFDNARVVHFMKDHLLFSIQGCVVIVSRQGLLEVSLTVVFSPLILSISIICFPIPSVLPSILERVTIERLRVGLPSSYLLHFPHFFQIYVSYCLLFELNICLGRVDG